MKLEIELLITELSTVTAELTEMHNVFTLSGICAFELLSVEKGPHPWRIFPFNRWATTPNCT